MQFTFTHEDLALVLFGRRVDGGDHGRGVGDQDGVHETPGHHADHDDPHLHIIWSTTNDNYYFFLSSLYILRWSQLKWGQSHLLVRPWIRRREQSSVREL